MKISNNLNNVVLIGVGMAQKPLSDRERVVMQLQSRYEFATSLLGVNPVARRMFRAMHLDNSGWNVSALSRAVNSARSTVRGVIKRNVAVGTLRFEHGLAFITPLGSELLIQIQRETFRIAFGQQVGFSANIIAIFRDVAGVKIDHRASTVCFPNDLPDFIYG